MTSIRPLRPGESKLRVCLGPFLDNQDECVAVDSLENSGVVWEVLEPEIPELPDEVSL